MNNELKLLLVAGAFLLPVAVMIGVYVFRDARRRGLEAGRWALMAALIPGLVGFICYLLERGRHEGQRNDRGFWVVLTALFLVPLVLAMYSNLYIFTGMEERYFLTRHEPDGSPRSGFVEAADITSEGWYGYTYTDFQTGEIVTVEKTQRGYTVNGEYRASGTGGGVSHAVPGQSRPFDMYREDVEGRYYSDADGNLEELELHIDGTRYLTLYFGWEDGVLTRQRLDGMERSYTETGSETRRGDLLLEYTVRSGPSEARYDADGNLLDTTVTTYTENGQVLTVEVFDPEGKPLSRMEFDYDHLNFLLRPYNLAILALVWAGLIALTCSLMAPDKAGARTVTAEEYRNTERRTPMEPKENKGKRSYAPLLWLALYIVNLLLVLGYQAVFVHNIPIPADNAEGYPDFSQVEFFAGCEILDTGGTPDEYHVLYRDADGVTRVVRLEGNLYLDRVGVIASTVTEIPAGSEEYVYEEPNFLGKNIITVTGGTDITGLESHGLMRQQATIQGFHMAAALALLLAEGALALLVRKLMRR